MHDAESPSHALLIITLTISALLGCGASSQVPTEAEGKKFFEEAFYRANAEHYWSLFSFRKTNGVASLKDGVKHYRMDCEIESEAKDGRREKAVGYVDVEMTEKGWQLSGADWHTIR